MFTPSRLGREMGLVTVVNVHPLQARERGGVWMSLIGVAGLLIGLWSLHLASRSHSVLDSCSQSTNQTMLNSVAYTALVIFQSLCSPSQGGVCAVYLRCLNSKGWGCDWSIIFFPSRRWSSSSSRGSSSSSSSSSSSNSSSRIGAVVVVVVVVVVVIVVVIVGQTAG